MFSAYLGEENKHDVAPEEAPCNLISAMLDQWTFQNLPMQVTLPTTPSLSDITGGNLPDQAASSGATQIQ